MTGTGGRAAERPDPDPVRRRALRRYRAFATALLAIAAAIYVATYVATEQVAAPGFWVLLVRAASEAAIVGGLADWFAVTALFRHPLGLPIPHTAVVPRNQDRIGQGLATFVERNFLDPALVVGRLRALGLAHRTGRWLMAGGNARAAADRVAASIPVMLNGIDDRQVKAFAQAVLSRRLKEIDFAPIIGAAMAVLRDSDRHHELLDSVLAAAERTLAENEDRIYAMVEERSRWWVPRRIDRRMAQGVIGGLSDLLGDLRDRDHELRHRFDAAVARMIEDLRHDPDYRRRVVAMRDQVLGAAEVQDYLGALWVELRRSLERGLGDPGTGGFRDGLADILQSAGAALSADRVLQDRIERGIEETVTAVLAPWRAEIGRFIADVVHGWEAPTIVERIELAVGRDLQYIRINGTVVGALVGAAIFTASWFLG